MKLTEIRFDQREAASGGGTDVPGRPPPPIESGRFSLPGANLPARRRGGGAPVSENGHVREKLVLLVG
jgi:hypothetical protein